jgi:formylglycine-generating enzyme required for sulfatase activity
VSWNDIQNYITTLNLQSGNSYRLPTEAEWQYAAQVGGFIYSGSNDVNAVAWYSGNSGNITQQVGQKQANGLGAYDMSGNVREWVYEKVLRGGSCKGLESEVTTIYRLAADPNYKGNSTGFRLAR